MIKLPLTQGKFAIVDDEDFEWLNQWKWCYLKKDGSAMRKESGKTVYLHRQIMNAGPGKEVDHIDGDKLNDRKQNLRLCNHQQNCFNRPANGVCWRKDIKKWRAYITVSGKQKFLGHFSNKQEALKIRRWAEKQYFGEFAYV